MYYLCCVSEVCNPVASLLHQFLQSFKTVSANLRRILYSHLYSSWAHKTVSNFHRKLYKTRFGILYRVTVVFGGVIYCSLVQIFYVHSNKFAKRKVFTKFTFVFIMYIATLTFAVEYLMHCSLFTGRNLWVRPQDETVLARYWGNGNIRWYITLVYYTFDTWSRSSMAANSRLEFRPLKRDGEAQTGSWGEACRGVS